MALQTAYKQFLAAPNAGLLASDASLHYITTLTSFKGPADITKHLNAQSHELKKEEKILSAVEGTDALAVEVHTTIEFKTGGGAYLPALDDNFLADRVVNLPIIHIVTFNADGKILQIRLNWDQGSLLKLIDIIGRTGRNWPIRDGKDQIKLISSSVKLADGGPQGEESDLARSRANSNHITRDPHATLSLFAPREKYQGDSLPAVVETRQSAAPPQRNYNELFVGGEAGGSSASLDKDSASPEKLAAPKAGAGKNYAPSRLFDDEAGAPPSDTLSPKVNAKKYQHFDFADGPDDEKVSHPVQSQGKNKHSSQWGFADFVTPAKVVPSKVVRTNEARHWGNSDDEVLETPIKFKKVDKPRKDTEPHFEFIDDGGLDEDKPQVMRTRGAHANKGMGLYKDTIFGEDENTPMQKKPAPIADTEARRKVFDSQFSMTDVSPAHKSAPQQISEDRAKAVKMMDANWSSYDQSPNPNQKENIPTSPNASRPANKGPLAETTNQPSQHKGINTAGDGMGGKKGLASQEHRSVGIATGGDGMGGKKGVSRSWGFGDDSGGEQEAPEKYKTGRTQGKRQPTGGDFWDF